MKKGETKRVRENFDTELALTNDIYQAAMKMVIACGWRTALRQVFYVASRISSAHGRKALLDFLQSDEAWR